MNRLQQVKALNYMAIALALEEITRTAIIGRYGFYAYWIFLGSINVVALLRLQWMQGMSRDSRERG